MNLRQQKSDVISGLHRDSNEMEVLSTHTKGLGLLPALSLRTLDSAGFRPLGLERLYVRSLPSLGALYDVELDGLAFLQALESI